MEVGAVKSTLSWLSGVAASVESAARSFGHEVNRDIQQKSAEQQTPIGPQPGLGTGMQNAAPPPAPAPSSVAAVAAASSSAAVIAPAPVPASASASTVVPSAAHAAAKQKTS